MSWALFKANEIGVDEVDLLFGQGLCLFAECHGNGGEKLGRGGGGIVSLRAE